MDFQARETRPGLTMQEAYEMESQYDWGGVLGSCEFHDWTWLTGPALFDVADPAKVATACGADACLAVAESTTWVLEMRYAQPDGTLRSRSYTITGPHGEPLPITLVVRKDGDGPLKRDDEGKEETQGTPLPGEPLDIQIADDERLCLVLSAIGFPVKELMELYGGTFDWKAMKFVPGPRASDRVFTAHVRGKPRAATPMRKERKGLLGRLVGR